MNAYDDVAYFKLSGDVWAVSSTGVPGQCRVLPKYTQVWSGLVAAES